MRRRELVVGAVAAGAAAALRVPKALAGSTNPDAATIENFVRLELTAAVVYEQLAKLPIDSSTSGLLSLLGEQEREHAAVLLNAAEYLGGPPQPAPTPAQVLRAAPALARARTKRDALTIASEVERIQLVPYYGGQKSLSDTKLLQQTATVMCSEAQHSVSIRMAMGADPIPSAFEVGVS